MNKIFGIGLPKTGTFSLCLAMKILGFKSLHYIEPNYFDHYVEVIEKNDFINDCPINYIFENLSSKFPNSKFICTTRDYESWIKSSKIFFKKIRNKNSIDHMMNLFETEIFEENKFKKSYRNHGERVNIFSKNNNVLFLPIENNSNLKWNLICDFLQIKKDQNKEYPWINKAKVDFI